MWSALLQDVGVNVLAFVPEAMTDILRLEQVFQVVLPDQLKDLLVEVGPISGRYGEGIVWGTEEIEKQNHLMRASADFRSLSMSFEQLFFFGDLGNGNLVGFRILQGEVDALSVFKWDHESDSRLSLYLTLEG
ncbi:SMI1/KNR4 family protein [Deinococcus sp. QL22]|uniref:SMI1/KNR4 family protein n=1 Tax=Deinococcus sp. QL22 TaxID=2939437 RepID=UPI002016D964|nr:SMI1/KNR4 family protein [Deinococcus sp. QL22]UQN09222.1 SMI1/KNR4 family protein [Deinococcus sp. QL22]